MSAGKSFGSIVAGGVSGSVTLAVAGKGESAGIAGMLGRLPVAALVVGGRQLVEVGRPDLNSRRQAPFRLAAVRSPAMWHGGHAAATLSVASDSPLRGQRRDTVRRLIQRLCRPRTRLHRTFVDLYVQIRADHNQNRDRYERSNRTH